jgi:hypothetical protein
MKLASSPFTTFAKDRLLGLRRPDGSWGYRPGLSGAAEPTALAGLALLALDTKSNDACDAARSAASWLAARRHHDGRVDVVSTQTGAAWTTAHAVMLWSALGDYSADRAAGVAWLLEEKGLGIPHQSNDPVGHDTTIIGWPWVGGTHSWVEPTSMALLALSREGCESHPRAREGARLLRDRAIPTGGWNYGNKLVYGTALRPHPGPTGLALLALSHLQGVDATILASLEYLKAALAQTRAAMSLGWGILGLRAWHSASDAVPRWLSEAPAHSRLHDSSVGLSLLLLASAERSLELLCPQPSRELANHA